MYARRLTSAAVALSLVAAACSGSTSTSQTLATSAITTTGPGATSSAVSTTTAAPTSTPATTIPATAPPVTTTAPTPTPVGAVAGLGDPKDCPLGALAKATDKVTIKFWYDWDLNRGEVLKGLVDEFNKSQDKIQIDASFHGGSPSTQIAVDYARTVAAADGPDVISANGIATQLMIDSRDTIPMGACVAADKADISDFLPAIRATGTAGDTLVAMPWGAGGSLLYYNRAAFTKAGLDPDKPPSTLAELRADSEAIVKSGAAKHGISLIASTDRFASLLSGGNPTFTASGADGRADHSTAEGPAGQDLISQLADMVKTGELIAFPPLGFDDVLALFSKDSAMTTSPAAAIGDITAAFAGGQQPNGVELGVAPIPHIIANQPVNLEGGGAPLWITKGSDPAKQEAAYRFAKWLVEPQQLFEWVSKTGSLPLRTSAVDLPALKDFYAANPLFRVAYDAIASAPPGPTANIRTGAQFKPVFDEMMVAVLTKGADPATALANATKQADAAMAEYNASITTG